MSFYSRKNTQLRTTPAGQYLCNEWERLLVDFRNSIYNAPEIQNDMPENLVIATTPSAQIPVLYNPGSQRFGSQSEIELRIDNCSIPEAKERLLQRNRGYSSCQLFKQLFNVEELEWEKVASCPLSVYA